MTPRLRIIAGPNGSGKSSLAQILIQQYAVNLYNFINSDELNKEIAHAHQLACPFSMQTKDLLRFVNSSTYPDAYKRPFLNGDISINQDDYVTFAAESINSYTAAIIADFFKDRYLAAKQSFSFETVFSHPSKVEIIRQAHQSGFRTYMYFIATADPCININRIRNRVVLGGHDVPEEKTRQRYLRCLEQIHSALPYLDRAYFFDNTDHPVFLAEYDAEHGTVLHQKELPAWFVRYVIGD